MEVLACERLPTKDLCTFDPRSRLSGLKCPLLSCQSGARILAIDQLPALCSGISLVDLRCDLSAVLSQPRFLLVQHRDRALNKLVDRLIGSALNILLDQIRKLGSKVNLHNRLFYPRS
jgi:hypothetical protein